MSDHGAVGTFGSLPFKFLLKSNGRNHLYYVSIPKWQPESEVGSVDDVFQCLFESNEDAQGGCQKENS